jgi:hypothetical protein
MITRHRLLACLGAAALAVGAAGSAQARPSAAPCATGGLVVWMDTQGDAAAGTTYFKLKLTNQSGHTCTLHGYPGVSAVNLTGHQLGSAGTRSPSSIPTVSLASGATTNVTLGIVVAGNYPPSSCHPAPAAGIRVYPPGSTASKIVPIPFTACSHSGPVVLHVKAVGA